MVKILICGDYCPQDRVQDLIEKEDYNSVLGEICPYTSMADYSIVNLESPVVNTPAFPIAKCGPNLRCSCKAVMALKFAGFNMVTLANNHFYDYGENGVRDTLSSCSENGLDIVGGGKNLNEASRIIYKEIKGVVFAFINCCEHEFSIATEKTGGANPLNPIQQYYAIQNAKQYAAKIIVIVHGGHEHYQLPSLRMKEIYRFFVDAGADAVINHHQHCYSGFEVYNDKPIFYGLGNFSFDSKGKRDSIWNEGYMVLLYFDDESIRYELIPYYQGNEKPGIKVQEDKSKFLFSIKDLNSIIGNDVYLKENYQLYLNSSKQSISCFLEPISNKWIRGLQKRGFFPRFINKKCLPIMANAIMCEAHRDKLEYFLCTEIRNINKK